MDPAPFYVGGVDRAGKEYPDCAVGTGKAPQPPRRYAPPLLRKEGIFLSTPFQGGVARRAGVVERPLALPPFLKGE